MIDVDKAQARRTRMEIVRDLIRDPAPAMGTHFPGRRFGRVVKAGGRRR